MPRNIKVVYKKKKSMDEYIRSRHERKRLLKRRYRDIYATTTKPKRKN